MQDLYREGVPGGGGYQKPSNKQTPESDPEPVYSFFSITLLWVMLWAGGQHTRKIAIMKLTKKKDEEPMVYPRKNNPDRYYQVHF